MHWKLVPLVLGHLFYPKNRAYNYVSFLESWQYIITAIKSKHIVIFNFSNFKKKPNTGKFQNKRERTYISPFFYNGPYYTINYFGIGCYLDLSTWQKFNIHQGEQQMLNAILLVIEKRKYEFDRIAEVRFSQSNCMPCEGDITLRTPVNFPCPQTLILKKQTKVLLLGWTGKTCENYRSVECKWLNSSKSEQMNRKKRHNRYL